MTLWIRPPEHILPQIVMTDKQEEQGDFEANPNQGRESRL